MKVVLVTGGAGFIGRHVVDALLKRGDKVVVIDDLSGGSEFDIGNTYFYMASICDNDVLQEIFDKHAPTHVCHLAARAGVRNSIINPFVYVDNNITGTVSLLEICAKRGIENFVYASSSSVYGERNDGSAFKEEDDTNEPMSQYAATKKSCELLAATYHSLYGINCTGLRFFTVYGPRGRKDMAPYKFMKKIMDGRTLTQYGNGQSRRDYTFIDDVVTCILLTLDTPLGNEILNVGTGTSHSLKTLISTIERVCNRKAIITTTSDQPGDVWYTLADTTKAMRMIGYKSTMSLEEGLQRMYDFIYTDTNNYLMN